MLIFFMVLSSPEQCAGHQPSPFHQLVRPLAIAFSDKSDFSGFV
jgi:hypothetical protein